MRLLHYLETREHFSGLRKLLPNLRGLAILDNDGQNRQQRDDGALTICYWPRCEVENYFVTPELLRSYALGQYPDDDLFADTPRVEVLRVNPHLTFGHGRSQLVGRTRG